MIFVDESGKRWKYIKVGSGLISTTIFIPIGILILAALFYMPGWGRLQPLAPFSGAPAETAAEQPQVDAASLSAGPASAAGTNTRRGSKTTVLGSATTVPASPASSPALTFDPPPSPTPPTDTTTSTPTPVPTPPSNSGQSSNPGKKDFGQSHGNN